MATTRPTSPAATPPRPAAPASRGFPRTLRRRVAALGLAAALAATAGCGAGGGSGAEDPHQEVDGGLGYDTALLIENAPDSAEPFVAVRTVAPGVLGATAEVERFVEPGHGLVLEDLLGPGTHEVSVEFASGFRSLPLTVTLYEGNPTTLWVARAASPPGALEGEWSGAYQEAVGTLHTLGLTIDAAGAVTQVVVDGLVEGTTGTTTETSERVVRMTLSDGRVAALVVDASHAHAGIVFESGGHGVLQRGGDAGPWTHASELAVGTWTGLHVALSATGLDVTDLRAAYATTPGSGGWSDGDVVGSFVGTTPLQADDVAFGRYACAHVDGGGNPGTFTLFLSADASYAFGAYLPADAGASLEGVTFVGATYVPPPIYDGGGAGYYDDGGYYYYDGGAGYVDYGGYYYDPTYGEGPPAY